MSDEAESEAPSGPPAPKPPMVVVALLALNLLLTGAGLFLAFTRGRAAHAARSLRWMAAAMRSGKRSGVQANDGMPSAAKRAA